jgi:hypothetical protein
MSDLSPKAAGVSAAVEDVTEFPYAILAFGPIPKEAPKSSRTLKRLNPAVENRVDIRPDR